MSEAQTTVKGPAESDAELIAAVRAGDTAAFAALYERHAGAARTVARSYLPPADADDVVGDAFTRVLGVLHSGGGPEIAFRAYLFTIVRRLCREELTGARRTAPTADPGTFESAMGSLASTEDPALANLERSMVARAFRSLPERWQAVLWYTEVEDLSPAQIAPLLGLSANGVAALAYRAREGLRQAYLREHLLRAEVAECAVVTPLLASYVRGRLARRECTRVEAHLDGCVGCSALLLELDSVAHGMRAVVAPLVFGAGALGLVGRALPLAGGSAVGMGPAGVLKASGRAAGTSGSAGVLGGSAVLVLGATLGVVAVAALGVAGLLGLLNPGTQAAQTAAVASAAPGTTDLVPVPDLLGPGPTDPSPSALPDVTRPTPDRAEPDSTWNVPVLSVAHPPGGEPSHESVSAAGSVPVLSLALASDSMTARVPSALQMTVVNSSAVAAERVQVGLTLPVGIESPITTLVTRRSATVLQENAVEVPCGRLESASEGTNMLICTLGTLPPGSEQPLELVVVADSGGLYTFVATVWAQGVDPVRQTFAPTTVSYFGPQVGVDPLSDVPLANPSETDLLVPIRNSGDQPANGIGVTFSAPDGLGVVGRDGWECQGKGSVTCTAPPGLALDPGERSIAPVTVFADGSSPGGKLPLRVGASATGGAWAGTRVVGVSVEAPWSGIEADAVLMCVGPADPGRTTQIVATVSGGGAVAESVTLVTDYGLSGPQVLQAGQAGGSRVQLSVTAAPWTPSGTATVVVQRTAAGTVYSREIPIGYPAADCYVPAWDADVAVSAAWAEGSIRLTGTVRNDTAEAMDVQMISAAYGASQERHLAPGQTATLTVDTLSDAVPDGAVTFAFSRVVAGRGHTATTPAEYLAAAYVPDWSGSATAALSCEAGAAMLTATWTNESAEAMTVMVKAPWDTGPAKVVAPGASSTVAAMTGATQVPGGQVTFVLSRVHPSGTYTAQASVDFDPLDCSTPVSTASLVLESPFYDLANQHSYRKVAVLLDNTGSTAPATFKVTGPASVGTIVPAGQSVTVPLGEVPWSGAVYLVAIQGQAAPITLTVDPFTAAPACLPAWSPAQWYPHTASASYNGWNYHARNAGIGVVPEGDVLSPVFWEPATRCGAG